MKMLIVLVMVLWAGMGWAEEETTMWFDPNPCGSITTMEGRSPAEDAKRYRERHECMMGLAERSNTFGPYYAGEAQKAQQHYDHCYLRMEAAMRAMDRFMPMVVFGDALGQVEQLKKGGKVDQEWLATFTLDAHFAEQEWKSVKRECWRKP